METRDHTIVVPVSGFITVFDKLILFLSYNILGTQDCFGTELPDNDKTLKALRNDCPDAQAFASDIQAYSAGFTETLARQLGRYLTGVLSVPTLEMFERTKNAPIHNMEAERTLGLVDSHMRRAPNAHIDLISAKVKCTKNKTINWLCSMPADKQRKVIRSAVKQRRSIVKQQKERKEHNLKVMNQRLYEKVEKKQKKETNQAERKAAKFLAQCQKLTQSDVEMEYPSLSAETVRHTVEICHSPASIMGKEFTHLWFDNEKCKWDLYCGSVIEYTQKEFTMEYWLPGCPEDSHEAFLPPKHVVADLILGDLVFT